MITATVFLLVMLVLLFFSIKERVRLRTSSYRGQKLWDVEPKATPFSEALLNLIGVAGGVYLSLIILFTFLEVTIPGKIQLAGIEVELLAAVSIGIAIIQPFFMRIWASVRSRQL